MACDICKKNYKGELPECTQCVELLNNSAVKCIDCGKTVYGFCPNVNRDYSRCVSCDDRNCTLEWFNQELQSSDPDLSMPEFQNIGDLLI